MKDYINENTVNIAVQVLPVSKTKDSYDLVDKAIEIIQNSGVKYIVTPFETVMEGKYPELMNIVKDVQNACYLAGSEKVMCYVKIQSVLNNDVTIDDKVGKYK
ncbi:thiamine-binding protein [Saccharicrinis aurantiacus]|uniref:thiamine-binding protein n=1 Tax=Saccharicrinis aurantiacus TaxID=1849719 RepID=UPI00094FFE5A|nr:thiamine-binding protein [Saccharicrinis aurantiacus]